MNDRRSIQDLTAADVMQTEIRSIPATMSVADAERVLSEFDIGGAPVTDAAGIITGVISLRDIAARNVERRDGGHAPSTWSATVEERPKVGGGRVGEIPIGDPTAATPSDVQPGIAGELGTDQTVGRDDSEERELERMVSGADVPAVNGDGADDDLVREVMTAQVHAVDDDTPLADLARTMVERGIHRVLVRRSGDARILGLVSTMDVVRVVARTSG